MKNLAILFLIATVLPSVWTRSHQEADDTLVEREDDLDITSLSEDELNQFVDEARESLKRAAEELFDDEPVQSQTPDKRQRLPPSPKFPVPKFNFKPPPPLFKTNFNLEELFDDGPVKSQTAEKRQRLPSNPRITLPSFKVPPPPVPKFPFKTNFNLGKGFSFGSKGLSFQQGNFKANPKPTFSFGKSGLKFTGGKIIFLFR
ncbi:uncharacterized protein LOC121382113 [Gigantopelta aegis]|uniref:uncharacterized protein LOC121382113 n=1 Tax=Gigantopelta aegis TaxID=1735272 RepID=UPI001B889EBE|nr:uncharacterized protein LOC121382113 [Gigantopelta aegis]